MKRELFLCFASLCFTIIMLIIISFTFGRRWEAYNIKNAIEANSFAISRWGDNQQIKITGKVESYNN